MKLVLRAVAVAALALLIMLAAGSGSGHPSTCTPDTGSWSPPRPCGAP